MRSLLAAVGDYECWLDKPVQINVGMWDCRKLWQQGSWVS
jgi:hypothetical protein